MKTQRFNKMQIENKINSCSKKSSGPDFRKHSCILWLLIGSVFIFALLLDLTYSFKLPLKLFTAIITAGKQYLGPAGLSYGKSLEILQSYIGALLTVLSLVLGITLTIAERSEKLIYGIRRNELENISQSLIYRSEKVVAWLAPALMIVCLNFRLCVSGYLLIIYSYTSLIYLYMIRNQSYSLEKSQDRVINFLMHCFTDPEQPLKEELIIYEMHLESIRTDAEKEGDWKSRQTLYLKYLEKIRILRPESFFILSTLFFDTVFVNRKEKNNQTAFHMLELYLWSVWKKDEDSTCSISPEDIFFASMLFSCIHKADENHLVQFLSWFLDFNELTRLLCLRYKKPLAIKTYHRQAVLLLIFLEEWLYLHDSSDRKLKYCLTTLWELVNYYFYNNDLAFADRIIDISAACMLFNDKRGLLTAKERLLADCSGLQSSMLHMLLNL